MSESMLGSICRNASTGAVCFCARKGSDRGKIVFKIDEIVIRVTCAPSEWTCKEYGQRHNISWHVGRVDSLEKNELGYMTNVVTRNLGDGSITIQAIARRLFGHLTFRAVGQTGCSSDEDPETSVTVSVERNGEKVSEAGPITVMPRGHDLSVDVDIGNKDVSVTATVVRKED